MTKKIFIIADHNASGSRKSLVNAAAQVLQEYDYDVVNALIVEDWEKRKVELGLYEDNWGWFRRDLKKMLDCDGACVLDDFLVNEYEERLAGIAMELPMFHDLGVLFLREWIER